MMRTRAAYRLLYKRLRLPRRGVHWALGGAKRLLLRDRVAHRARLGRSLSPPLRLDEAKGYLMLGAETLPGAMEASGYARSLLERYRAQPRDTAGLERNPAKAFLLSVLSGSEFAEHPPLLRLMLSRGLLDTVSAYLGTVPYLEGAALWWTPPNRSARSSQAWHIDELAPRQVKVILNCDWVAADQGPLHLLPADVSERVRSAADHRRGRLPDAVVTRHAPADAVIRAEGGPATGVMFDSSRCLHFGSRGNRRDRLVLAFHYLPIDAPTETRYHLTLPGLPAGLGPLDEVQRLAVCPA